MPRAPRRDSPGAWLHVTNRGITNRPIFERRRDVRYFLSRLARAVRRGEIEVHAYCLLTTHFHLLIRSVIGRADLAMQRIQGEYSRYFNRTRDRTGGLYRSRYGAKVVGSQRYWDNVVRYIDGNAAKAGIVTIPEWWKGSSAHWFSKPKGPPWLSRSVVEQRAAERCNVERFRPGLYARASPPRLSPGHEAWIQRRLNGGDGRPDALDDIIDAAPRVVLDWMRRNAAVADGVSVGLPLIPWEDVVFGVGRVSALLESLDAAGDRRRCSVAAIAMAGLLRDVASLTVAHIGEIMGTAGGTVQHRVRRHRSALTGDDRYAGVVAGVIHKAFDNIR